MTIAVDLGRKATKQTNKQNLEYKVVTGFVCEVHNNCELPVGIYNICECLVWVGRRCSARCGVDICD